MKHILEFNLPEEREELDDAMKGSLYKLVIEDLDNELRAMIKYQDKAFIELQHVRNMIVRLKENYEIS